MKVTIKPFLFLCFVICVSCSTNKDESPKRKMVIHVAQAKSSDSDRKKEFSFISKPYRTSELSFRVGGPIDRFDVYPGNQYKQGSMIAEIDPRDFRIRKERAEAVYNQAKAEFERIETLYHKNNVSASTYEKAKADHTSAKMAYETATNELSDTHLIAPFTGYIGEVYIEKFQDVKATQPILSLVDIGQLRIETYVTQDIAFKMSDIKNVKLRFDAIPDTLYDAQVMDISKSTTKNNLSYLMTAMLPNKDGKLLSGMSGSVIFDSDNQVLQSVSVPQTAICHRPSVGDYVWIADPSSQTVSQRMVTLGEMQEKGIVSVTGGIKEGEMVAVSGLRFLSEGMSVEFLSGRK